MSQYDDAVNSGMSQLSTMDKNYQAPIDIYNKALSDYGVNDARTKVQDLRTQLANSKNLLAGIEPSVNARTSGALVTEGQRQGIVGHESQPFQKLVSSISDSLDSELQNYGIVLGQAQKATDYTIQGNDEKRAAILDQIKLNIQLSQNEAQKQQWIAEYNQKANQFDQQAALERAKLNEAVRHDKQEEALAYYNG